MQQIHVWNECKRKCRGFSTMISRGDWFLLFINSSQWLAFDQHLKLPTWKRSRIHWKVSSAVSQQNNNFSSFFLCSSTHPCTVDSKNNFSLEHIYLEILQICNKCTFFSLIYNDVFSFKVDFSLCSLKNNESKNECQA